MSSKAGQRLRKLRVERATDEPVLLRKRTQHPRIEIYQEAGQWLGTRRGGMSARGWRWRLVGKNGKILADSGEAYTRKADVKRALGTVLEAIDRARIIEKE